MTVSQWLKTATAQLNIAGIGTARLDATVLLADVLNKNSAQVLAHTDQPLAAEHIKLLNKQLKRRASHEPLAYIRGRTEFYGREFIVNKHVLEPRPETETMIDLALKLPGIQGSCVVDVGTGSGAIAITLACELHEVQVLATDIDPNCLKVARANADKHQATIVYSKMNLLEALKLPKDYTILANLPYVPATHTINQAAMQEPSLAIFGGPDGLDLYRQLFEQISGTTKPRYILTESLPPQHVSLAKIAAYEGYRLKTTDDFIQVFTIA